MTDTQHASRSTSIDRLPPHSVEAERGLIGCVFWDSAVFLRLSKRMAFKPLVPAGSDWRDHRKAKEKEQVQRESMPSADDLFFDQRHAIIWRAFERLHADGFDEISVITAHQMLTNIMLDRGENPQTALEAVGGVVYLNQCQDESPSAANADYFFEILAEQYARRRVIRLCQQVAREAFEGTPEGEESVATDEFLARVCLDFAKVTDTFSGLAHSADVAPQDLKTIESVGVEGLQTFFMEHHLAEVPGIELPWGFPWKIRPGETSLIFAEEKTGKTTLLYYLTVHLLSHPEQKALLVSLEMPKDITFWELASMLVGFKSADKADDERLADVAAAYEWLKERVIVYDFVGIGNWRQILRHIEYAVQYLGVTWVVLDSIMRMGIPDDDYGQQGVAAMAFSKSAKDLRYHNVLVNHANKSDSRGTAKGRGSALWPANVDNNLSLSVNRDKQNKLSDLNHQLGLEKDSSDTDPTAVMEIEKELAKVINDWDTKLILENQRYPGARRNGSIHLNFDHSCFQLAHTRDPHPPMNWLRRWSGERERVDVDPDDLADAMRNWPAETR